MAYPDIYDVTYSYTGFQEAQGDDSFPGTQLDSDLAGLEDSIDNIALFIRGVMRSDGRLQNGIVTYESLSASLQVAGIAPAYAWVTATPYAVDEPAVTNGKLYRALVAHTSGVFATDLAAGKWIFVSDILLDPFGYVGVPTNLFIASNGTAYVPRAIVGSDLPAAGTIDLGAVFALPASLGKVLGGIGADGAPTWHNTISGSASASLTGSAAGNALLVTQTWNTSGVPVGFKVAITDLGHGAGSQIAGFYGGAGGVTPLWLLDTVGNSVQVGQHGVGVAAAFAQYVGRLGATTPAWQIDSSAASSITGLKLTAANAGGGVALTAQGEANVDFNLAAVGTGKIKLNSAATAVSINGSVVSPGHYTGEPSNASAGAGEIGELVVTSVVIGSAVGLTTAVALGIASVSLPAGDWDVSALAQFTGGATTTVGLQRASISTVANTLDTSPGRSSDQWFFNNAIYANLAPTCAIPPTRISLSVLTTVHLVVYSSFGTSTSAGFGTIRARRAR